MRIEMRDKPRYGTTRVNEKFFILPRVLRNNETGKRELRWLERSMFREEYMLSGPYSVFYGHWVPIEWIEPLDEHDPYR